MEENRAFRAALYFRYQPPFFLLPLTGCCYVVALICSSLCNLPIPARLGLSAFILFFCLRDYRTWRDYATGQSRVSVLLNSNNQWSVQRNGERYDNLMLEQDILVHHQLTILRLTTATGRTFVFVLTPANLPADTFRRLRVRLLYARFE